jgi:hypothetical protein
MPDEEIDAALEREYQQEFHPEMVACWLCGADTPKHYPAYKIGEYLCDDCHFCQSLEDDFRYN